MKDNPQPVETWHPRWKVVQRGTQFFVTCHPEGLFGWRMKEFDARQLVDDFLNPLEEADHNAAAVVANDDALASARSQAEETDDQVPPNSPAPLPGTSAQAGRTPRTRL